MRSVVSQPVVAVLLLFSMTLVIAQPNEPSATDKGPSLTAKSAILIDVETGEVLFERNANEVRYPASLTKIMTALLTIEAGNLDAIVRVSPTAASIGESTVYLQAGDQVLVRDLLMAALLPSANDACMALAEHVAGSVPAFVERMNVRARELGLAHTHFENPHGLHDEEHVSSARDLATLTREALGHPEFRRLVALEKAKFTYRRPGVEGLQTTVLQTSNRLLRTDNEHYWKCANGVKTGYTRQAGRCLCASATVDGWQLMCVVLGCQDSWFDARALLEWGFAHFRPLPVVRAQHTRASVHVTDGAMPLVEAVAKSSIKLILPIYHPLPRPHLAETYPVAPVHIGDPVGELVVYRQDGTELRSTLVATQEVPLSLRARLRQHAGVLILGVVGLTLVGAILVHGAIAQTVGPRRRRFAESMRGDDKGRPCNGRWKSCSQSGSIYRSRRRSGAT